MLHCLRWDVRGVSGQLAVPAALDNRLAESGLSVLAAPGFQHHAHTPSLVSSHPSSRLCRNWLRYNSVQCCFTSTETVRTIRDGEPRDGLLDFHTPPEQLFISTLKFNVALRPQSITDYTDDHLDFHTARELC